MKRNLAENPVCAVTMVCPKGVHWKTQVYHTCRQLRDEFFRVVGSMHNLILSPRPARQLLNMKLILPEYGRYIRSCTLRATEGRNVEYRLPGHLFQIMPSLKELKVIAHHYLRSIAPEFPNSGRLRDILPYKHLMSVLPVLQELSQSAAVLLGVEIRCHDICAELDRFPPVSFKLTIELLMGSFLSGRSSGLEFHTDRWDRSKGGHGEYFN
jgi:hypothetical protein